MFTHSNLAHYETTASLLALDDAQSIAWKMAEHMGIKLGKILDMSYYDYGTRDPFTGNWYYNRQGTGSSTGGILVSPGIITVTQGIQLKYSIE
jgi:uncharacterized protein YggE